MKLSDIEKKWRAWKRENPVKLPAYSCLDRYGEQEPMPKPVRITKRGGSHCPQRARKTGGKIVQTKSEPKPLFKKKYYKPVIHLPEQGEVSIKEWALNIAKAEGLCYNTIWQRIKRGKYPFVHFRHVNPRVVFVREPNGFEI